MAKRIFCNAQCSEGFQNDRRAGVIYPPVRNEDGSFSSWYPAHVEDGLCPYCRRQVVAYRRHSNKTED